VQRILIGRIVATIGAAIAVIGTFLPWLRSGARRRNSYEIFSLVDRLGFSPSSPVGLGLRLWPLLPLLMAVSITLHWFPRRWFCGAATLVAVTYAGGVAAAVQSAPSTSYVGIERGALATLAGSLILLIGALLTWQFSRLANRP
jgi:hypothetical protein